MNTISLHKNRDTIILLGVLIVTFLVYLPSLKYGFYSNLDDGRLILNNPVVTNFAGNFKAVFSEFVYGLYHPATTISFIFDYSIFGNNPFAFRIHNLLLHLINTLLVFLFVKKLSNKSLLALITASVFALHPLHIESVIWISERKDVLFTFWFLLAGIAYINFSEKHKSKWLLATYLFFILSLLSKATAVVFPVVMVLIDYYYHKKVSVKNILSKWLFFLLSICFGLINIKAQNSIDFIQPIAYKYNLLQLVTIPVYSLTYYITHFFAPVGLAAKHLYPKVVDGSIGIEFYLGWVWLLLLALMVYKSRKNRLFVFGILFYLVAIVLTLKIIPTGNDIVSERYSYIPYIGLCIAFGSLLIQFFDKKAKAGLSVLIGVTVLLSLLSFNQTKYWKSEVTIWSKVIKTEPKLPLAYFERGNAYRNNKQFVNAIADYGKAIEYSPNFYMSYIYRGLSYYYISDNNAAYADFTSAIKLNPQKPEGYYNRGNLLIKTNKNKLALADLEKSIALKIDINDVWYYKGIAEKHIKEYEIAIESYKRYLGFNPNSSKTELEIAECYYLLGQYNKAEIFYVKLLQADINNIKITYLLSNTLSRQEKYSQAIVYYTEIINSEPNFKGAWLNRGNAYYFLGNNAKACFDWQQAVELGAAQAQQMIDRYCE